MLLFPLFLDQNFWAARVHQLRLGPKPIPFRDVTPQSLGLGLSDLLSGHYSTPCSHMARLIPANGDGATAAAEAIALRIQTGRMSRPCALIAELPAQWRHSDSGLFISGPAAASLFSQRLARWSDFELLGSMIYSRATWMGNKGSFECCVNRLRLDFRLRSNVGRRLGGLIFEHT